MYVDSHAHLEMPQFDADREAMLERAHAAGVECILAIGSGTGPGSLDCAILFAERFDWIYATIGIHPHEAKLATENDYQEMESLSRHPKVIAWGEIGLDYHYDHSPREVQKEVFVRQMELAIACGLPIVIHNRPSADSENAWEDLFLLLDQHWAGHGQPGILHCFTGNPQQMRRAVEMGFLISFSGNITFAKAHTIREAAQATPLDHMLIETDSPFLAPAPNRGQRNEPAFVCRVAEKIAEIRNTSVEEIATATRHNFYRFQKLCGKIQAFPAEAGAR